MKLTDKQYTMFCRILENRGYRYYDEEERYLGSDVFATYKNINKRIQNNKQNEVLRFNSNQKDFIRDMLEEYRDYNCENDVEDKITIDKILSQLKK